MEFVLNQAFSSSAPRSREFYRSWQHCTLRLVARTVEKKGICAPLLSISAPSRRCCARAGGRMQRRPRQSGDDPRPRGPAQRAHRRADAAAPGQAHEDRAGPAEAAAPSGARGAQPPARAGQAGSPGVDARAASERQLRAALERRPAASACLKLRITTAYRGKVLNAWLERSFHNITQLQTSLSRLDEREVSREKTRCSAFF